jgi:hypothetical protein
MYRSFGVVYSDPTVSGKPTHSSRECSNSALLLYNFNESEDNRTTIIQKEPFMLYQH